MDNRSDSGGSSPVIRLPPVFFFLLIFLCSAVALHFVRIRGSCWPKLHLVVIYPPRVHPTYYLHLTTSLWLFLPYSLFLCYLSLLRRSKYTTHNVAYMLFPLVAAHNSNIDSISPSIFLVYVLPICTVRQFTKYHFRYVFYRRLRSFVSYRR